MIRFGSTNQIISQPLDFGIINSQIDERFSPVRQSPQQNCQDLLQQKLDVAIISALDYVRNTSELLLLKDIAVFSQGMSKHALLFFQENLKTIERIVHYQQQSQYVILANIFLNEFFHLHVDWESLSEPESLEHLLEIYPACFLEGEQALNNSFKGENFLDLTQEWYDKTGLSFTHQLMAVRREEDHPPAILEKLQLSRELGMRNLMSIAKDYAADKENTWDVYFDLINEMFSYFPNEETWNSLNQYYEYLFYYGVIDFIPELKFFE